MDSQALERQFLELYDTQADAVFRHASFRVHDREVAKDLTQEAFTHFWEYLRKGKTVVNTRAFVFRIVNNLIIDYYRKKKEISLDVLAEAGFDPSGDDHERITAAIAGKEALAAVGRLEAEYQQVIILRYVNELSITEITDITGESENAISVRIHRALKKLKEFLEHGPN